MSTGMTERTESAAGGLVVKPQSVGMTQASQRVVAEAQAALMIAASRPRDEVDAIDRIKTSCQRQRLAESAEYCFKRGGTEITGPSIKLLEVVAAAWGNIQSGFRELSRANGESVVEAFAWDLQTNNKKVMEFTVKHWRDTKQGGYQIKDERDIYELIANMAQRRVRKCLESVIPRDVVDEALDECSVTLNAKVDMSPARIKSMGEAFLKEHGVTSEMIEKRIGRRLESIAPAQFISLRKIYTSLKEGMSQPAEWFDFPKEAEQEEGSATDKLKAALKPKPAPQPETHQEGPSSFDQAREAIESATSPIDCKAAYDAWLPRLEEGDQADLHTVYQAHLKTYPTETPKKSKDGKLPLQG